MDLEQLLDADRGSRAHLDRSRFCATAPRVASRAGGCCNRSSAFVASFSAAVAPTANVRNKI